LPAALRLLQVRYGFPEFIPFILTLSVSGAPVLMSPLR
jgi:hypothetical protein